MSAPDTNIKTQEKQHKGALGGMAGVIVLAVVVMMGLLAWMAWNSGDPAAVDGTDTPPAAEETGNTGSAY